MQRSLKWPGSTSLLAELRPNGPGAQLHPTALTANAGAHAPAARRVPRADWTQLLGVSCSALLGGGRKEETSAPAQQARILARERPICPQPAPHGLVKVD